MTIETKHNIGDEVWVVRGGRARVGHIESACFHRFMTMGELHTRITYDISSEGQRLYHVDEIDIFPTKEGLLKSL
jgi:hypothetical protein